MPPSISTLYSSHLVSPSAISCIVHVHRPASCVLAAPASPFGLAFLSELRTYGTQFVCHEIVLKGQRATTYQRVVGLHRDQGHGLRLNAHTRTHHARQGHRTTGPTRHTRRSIVHAKVVARCTSHIAHWCGGGGDTSRTARRCLLRWASECGRCPSGWLHIACLEERRPQRRGSAVGGVDTRRRTAAGSRP
jgi:hypothetical protein